MPQERYEAALELAGVNQYRSGMEAAAAALGIYENALTSAQRRQLGFALASGTAAAGIAAGIIKTVAAAGKMQQTEIGFRTLLGSAEAARAKIEELQKFAAQTPFSFQDLAQGTQLLMGMGAEADQTIPIMRALGNAMAASGKGAEDFNGALLQIAQIINSGKLQGDEMRILAERGVPTKELMDELGTSMGNVGKAGITAERFLAALIKVMSQGKYANAMADQSKTLFGALSNLGDAANQLSVAMGQPLVEPITKGVKVITDLANALNKADPATKTLAATVGVVMVGGLAAYSIGTVLAINRTIRLAEAHLAAAAAATAHANAQKNLNGAMAGQPSGVNAVPVGGAPAGKGGKGVPGGVKFGLAALAGEIGLQFLPDEGIGGDVKKHGGRALGGAGLGALIGSVVPGLGTVAGGLLGGAIGVGGGMLMDAMAKPESATPTADPQLEELRKQNEYLKTLVQQNEAMKRGDTFINGKLSGAYAAMAGQNRRIIA